MIMSISVPALAASTTPAKLTWQDGFGFHCNANGSNTQTSVEYKGTNAAVQNSIKNIKKQPAGSMVVEKGDQKDIFGTKTYPIDLVRVGNTTVWDLQTGTDIKCMTCGSTEWITYSNQNGVINGKNIQANHPPAFEIIKLWECLKDDCDHDGVEALFDVYKWDVKKAVRGEQVLDGVGAGRHRLEDGTYLVVEREKEGYTAQKSEQVITVKGTNVKVTFINERIPGGEDGSLSFEKRVDGKNIAVWLAEKYPADAMDILAGLEFYLDGDNGNYGPVVPDEYGMVVFQSVEPGLYTLTEEVTGAAAGKFIAINPIVVEIFDGEDVFIFISGTPGSYGSGGSGSVTIPEGPFAIGISYDSGSPMSLKVEVNEAAAGLSARNLLSKDVNIGDIALFSSIPKNDDWWLGNVDTTMQVFGANPANDPDDPWEWYDEPFTALNLWDVEDVAYFSTAFYPLWVTDGEGKEHVSFCGDIWAKTHQTDVVIDDTGKNADKEALLTAALEYINANFGGLGIDMDVNARELAQGLVTFILHDEIEKINITNWNQDRSYENLLEEILDMDLIDWYDSRVAELGEGVKYVAGVLTLVDPTGNQYQDQIVPYFGQNGGGAWVQNDTPTNGGEDGTLSFEKRVEGENIVDWLMAKYNDDVDYVMAILAGLEFYLDGENGKYGPETPDDRGMVVFGTPEDGIAPGIYVLSEEITGAAIGIFKQMKSFEIEIFEGEDSYYTLGGKVYGGEDGTDFDFDALYTTYSKGTIYLIDGRAKADGGLNANGNVQQLYAKNAEGGDDIISFCANAGSTGFTHNVYKAMHVPAEKDLTAVTAALNYIYEKYGSLDSFNGFNQDWNAFNAAVANYETNPDAYNAFVKNQTRLLSQIAVWAFFCDTAITLDQITYYSDINPATGRAFAGSYIPDQYRIAIEDLFENYLTGEGDWKFAYLVCDKCDNDIICQPQLVPYKGTFYVENEFIPGGEDGGVSFQKVKYGGLLPIDKLDEFGFELFLIDGEDEISQGIYYTDEYGKVAVENLEPGNYVFREVMTYDPDTIVQDGWLYRFVWNAIYPCAVENCDCDNDGLYFTILANGDTEWLDCYDLNEEGEPTVNNEFFCKHTWLWSPDGFKDETTNPTHGHQGWERFVILQDFSEGTCTMSPRIFVGCNAEGCTQGIWIELGGVAKGHDLYYDLASFGSTLWGTQGRIAERCNDCAWGEYSFNPEVWCEVNDLAYDPADWCVVCEKHMSL